MKLFAFILITLALGASAANLRNRAAPVAATGDLSEATKAAIADQATAAAGRDEASEAKEAEVVSAFEPTRLLAPPPPLLAPALPRAILSLRVANSCLFVC